MTPKVLCKSYSIVEVQLISDTQCVVTHGKQPCTLQVRMLENINTNCLLMTSWETRYKIGAILTKTIVAHFSTL